MLAKGAWVHMRRETEQHRSVPMTTNPVRTRLLTGGFARLLTLVLLGSGLHIASVANAAPAKENSLASLVERLLPAVVSIEVETTAIQAGRVGRDSSPPAIRRFFREQGIPEPRDAFPGMPSQRKGGSGFFIDDEGHVVTNWHIVKDAHRVTVRTDDGRTFEAKRLGHDPETDLALLATDPDAPPSHLEFADSDAVRIGDPVIAIGSPFGFTGSVTSGIVSARGRSIGVSPFDDFLQVDAAINRGNSGGPTFDLEGRVIGVNTAIFSPSGANAGIGFAIPSNTVRHVITDLMDDGQVERGWLGIHIQRVDEDLALALGLDNSSGALVAEVVPGSPAEEAGLRVGDAIVAVNGKQVRGPRIAARMVAIAGPDTEISITVWREGSETEIPVHLGKRPGTDTLNSSPVPLGLSLGNDDAPGAIVAGIEPGSEAERKNLHIGDRILSVDGEDVSNAADVSERLRQARKGNQPAVLLRIERGGDSRLLALKLRNA